MILVDSSVWIDALNRQATPQTEMLRAARYRSEVATADLVLVEVLQGCRDERAAATAQELMLAFNLVVVSSPGVAIAAARNYRLLRSRGVTVRKTIDVLIATRCIVDRLPLLHNDRDFEPFVEHLGLRSALDLPGVD